MAHYAYIDKETNIVVAVIVGKDETEIIDGLDTETYYALNTPYLVKRTSYNKSIRKNFAGIGSSWDESRDAFIPAKPYPSWVLDEETCDWVAPIPKPSTNLESNYYEWVEETQQWRRYRYDLFAVDIEETK